MYLFHMTCGISVYLLIFSKFLCWIWRTNKSFETLLRNVMKWRFAFTRREQWSGFAQEWYWYATYWPWMICGVSKTATRSHAFGGVFPIHLLVAAPSIWRCVCPGRWTAVVHRWFPTLSHSFFPPFHEIPRDGKLTRILNGNQFSYG